MQLNKKPIIVVIGKQGQGKSYLCNLMSDNRNQPKQARIFKEAVGLNEGVTKDVKVYETKTFGGKPDREVILIDMPGLFQKEEDNMKVRQDKPESIRVLEELNDKIQKETNGKVTFFLFCVSLMQRWDSINTKIMQILKKFVPETRIILVGTQKNRVLDGNDDGVEIKLLEKDMKSLQTQFSLMMSFLVGNQFDDVFDKFYINMISCDNVNVKTLSELSEQDLKEVNLIFLLEILYLISID